MLSFFKNKFLSTFDSPRRFYVDIEAFNAKAI